MFKLLSIFFFTWAAFLIWQRNAPLPLPSVALAKEGPTTLSIPDLNISLPVLAEPLTPKGVTYESHGSNLVFYGHNWPNILRPFQKAKVGQKIVIGYANGTTKQFEISTLTVVPANHISILEAKDYQLLTIYTCTGFLDRQRLVATALPI